MRKTLNIFNFQTTILILILCLAVVFIVRENRLLTRKIESLEKVSIGLLGAVEDLAKKDNVSLRIAPEISTNLRSVMGANRQITMNYYISIDGATMKTAQIDTDYKLQIQR